MSNKNKAVTLLSNTELMNEDLPLGINGYAYADFHQLLRLRDLQKTFEDSVQQHDQDLDSVDFPSLNARLRQNTVQEKLSNCG